MGRRASDFYVHAPEHGKPVTMIRWHHNADGWLPELIRGYFISGTQSFWIIRTDAGQTVLDLDVWAPTTKA